MSLLAGLTLFVSASLLFWVQPMFAKMILPSLGGTPSVWNTCLVFYQTVLLLGYLYAHALSRGLRPRSQMVLHGALLLLALLYLPLGFSGAAPGATDSPVFWLLKRMTVTLGPPFFVLSASAPLFQRWFSYAAASSGKDPYVLYATSNLGSLAALLAYPVFIEANFRTATQSRLWAAGFGTLCLLTAGFAATTWRSLWNAPVDRLPGPAGGTDRSSPAQALRWTVLAFIPSSLLMGVTTYIGTDIAPIPLLWVVPLALYLLTFVLVFARRPPVPREVAARALPILAPAVMLLILTQSLRPLGLVVPLHLLNFFAVAMVCHGELASGRPAADRLTEFYLWLAVGGALGGVFNALVGPAVFDRILEYPLVIAAACFFNPSRGAAVGRRPGVGDVLLPLGPGLAVGFLPVLSRGSGLDSPWFHPEILLVLATMACFLFSTRPVRLGVCVAGIFVASLFVPDDAGRALLVERNFYGVKRVMLDPSGRFRWLVHGNTIHGGQRLAPDPVKEPLVYYHRGGPAGQFFDAFKPAAPGRVAVVGLGAGSLCAYGKPGQEWTFYEIDPAMERIARDPRRFTFLQDLAFPVEVVLGDARLSLARAPDRRYGLIVVDAFGSDYIPVHLLTKEALDLYLRKLTDGGLLLFHISNKYVDVKPVLGDLVRAAGLKGIVRQDAAISREELAEGKTPSRWAAVARDGASLRPWSGDPRWQALEGGRGTAVWTDDFSNVAGAIVWR